MRVFHVFFVGLIILSSGYTYAQDHGFSAFEGKNIEASFKMKKPRLFSRLEKGEIGIRLKFKNNAEENVQLNFQLFVYENGLALSESEEYDVCIKPKKKKVLIVTREPLSSGQEWELKNIKTSIIENCPTQ